MKAFWAVVAVLVVVGCAWGYAHYDNGDRVNKFYRGLGELRYVDRGGTLTSDDDVLDQIEELAAEVGVDLGAYEVDKQPLSAANIDKTDAATQMVAGKMAEGERSTRRVEAGGETIVMKSGQAELKGTVITVTVDVRAEKWFWSLDDHLEFIKTVGRQIVMDR